MIVWTKEEEATLTSLAGCGIGRALAALPGRSRQAIKKRAFRLNVKLGANKDDWTPEEDGVLRSGVNGGLEWEAIAELLSGRSVGACARRWQRISTPAEMGVAWVKTDDSAHVEAVVQHGGFTWFEDHNEGTFFFNYRGEVIGHRAVSA